MTETHHCNEIEIHPYNDIGAIPDRVRTLIVGTCPPGPNTRKIFDWYYGSSNNLLWKHIFSKAKYFPTTRPISKSIAQQFFKKNDIWAFDIFQEYRRRCPKSALDRDIIPVRLADLRMVLMRHPSIDRLVITGVKAENHVRKYMEDNKLLTEYKFNHGMKGKQLPRQRVIDLCFDDRQRIVTLITVASPSRRNGSESYVLPHFQVAFPNLLP